MCEVACHLLILLVGIAPQALVPLDTILFPQLVRVKAEIHFLY